MRAADILRQALRALARLKLRSALTIAGVLIGIAAMVLLVGFGVQAQRRILEELKTQEALATITVTSPALGESRIRPDPHGPRIRFRPAKGKSDQAPAELDEGALERLRSIRGVEQVFPNILLGGWLAAGEASVRCVVTGVNPGVTEAEAGAKLREGKFFSRPGAREALLTSFLAGRLAADGASLVGKKVRLNYVKLDRAAGGGTKAPAPPGKGGGNAGPGGFRIQTEEFLVVGVVREGEYLRTGATFMRLPHEAFVLPLDVAVGLHRQALDPSALADASRGKASGQYLMASVVVADSRPEAVRRVRNEIEALHFPTVHVYDMLQNVQWVFLIIDLFLGALGSIALLVAALQIVNTLSMAILERTREIGVMKAVGARNRDVRRLFVCEGLLIGLIGGAAGVAAAWAAGRTIEVVLFKFVIKGAKAAADTRLFTIPWWLALGGVAFAMGVSLAAALVPAHRAARVDPVLALRRE